MKTVGKYEKFYRDLWMHFVDLINSPLEFHLYFKFYKYQYVAFFQENDNPI